MSKGSNFRIITAIFLVSKSFGLTVVMLIPEYSDNSKLDVHIHVGTVPKI